MTEQSQASESADTSPPQWKRPLAAFAVVAIGGPIAGAAVVLIALLPSLISASLDAVAYQSPVLIVSELIGNIATVFLFAMGFSFILAGVQAALAGLWVGYRTWRKVRLSYLEALATSAVIAVATFPCLALLSGRTAPWDWQGSLALCLILGLPALPAALFCRWLLGRLGLVPPLSASAS